MATELSVWRYKLDEFVMGLGVTCSSNLQEF